MAGIATEICWREKCDKSASWSEFCW